MTWAIALPDNIPRYGIFNRWLAERNRAWSGRSSCKRLQALFIRAVDTIRICARHSTLVGEFSTPFDEFEPPGRSGPAVRRGMLALWVQTALRGLRLGSLTPSSSSLCGERLANVSSGFSWDWHLYCGDWNNS